MKKEESREKVSPKKKKKKIYAAVRRAIPPSAAAIREHNVKCHSESVSSAALSQEKARRSGGAEEAQSKDESHWPSPF